MSKENPRRVVRSCRSRWSAAGWASLLVGWSAAGAAAGEPPPATPAPAVTPEVSSLDAALTLEKTLVDAIAKAEKSVVAIARYRRDLPGPAGAGPQSPRPRLPSEGQGRPSAPNEFGTGVVIDRQGLILTNYHLLGDPEQNIYQVWVGRRPFKAVSVLKAAEVKAGDPWTDLAILKIEADDLEPIALGDGKSLKKGQLVIALGNPYNIADDGQVSASWGIIANLGRKSQPAASTAENEPGKESLYHYGGLIQVDAKLNLGTSGGALINLKGELIGLITTLGPVNGYEKSMGFAIPVDDVFRRTIEALKVGRKAEFGFLGVAPENLSDSLRQRGQPGVRVTQVVPGTPAFLARLQEGDVITRINGQAMYDREMVMCALGQQAVGAEVKLTLERTPAPSAPPRVVEATAKLTKRFILSSRPAYAQIREPRWRGATIDYSTALPPLLLKQALQNSPPDGCLAVVEVDRDSSAWKAGLRPGTLITHAEGQRLLAPEQLVAAVKDQAGPVRLKIVTNEEQTVTVAP